MSASTASKRYEGFELLFLLFGSTLFAFCTWAYWSDVSFIDLLLGIESDGNRVLIGKFEKTEGSVRRKGDTEQAFRDSQQEKSLYNRDTIVTGAESTALLKFDDGSELQLGPKTMIRLEFQDRLTFGGIDRAQTIRVVSGKVEGKATSRPILLKTAKETIQILSKEPAKSVQAVNPAPVVPAAPEPVPEAKPEVKTEEPPPPVAAPIEAKKMVLKLLSPTPSMVLAVPLDAKIPEAPLKIRWTSNVPQGSYVIQVKQNQKVLFEKTVQSKSTEESLQFPLAHPGSYEVSIVSPATAASSGAKAQSSFEVGRSYRGISILSPLVAGKENTSNEYTGDVVEALDITLRWQSAAPLKDYKLDFYHSAEDPKPFQSFEVKEPSLLFKKSQVPKGMIFYQISGQHASGFLLTSAREPFRFDFLPPKLKFPPHKAALSRAEVNAEKGEILFTWQKTNFTDYYQFDLSQDPALKQQVKTIKSKENFLSMALSKNGTYYWRVRSFGQGILSPPTPIFQFVIK